MAQEIADSKLIDTWGSGGLKVEPDVGKIIEGWQFGEQPPHEYMNWLQNTFGSKLNHILKNGIAKWDDETEYLAGSSVQHSGKVWICETTNTNSEPTDLNANWEKVAINKDLTVTVDTLADLRNISYPANTVWASGYHTKNDGAFGSHIFRLKGVKTTETDNGGTVIIATIGGVDYVYELQFDGAVNVKWFGAKGDEVTDDTNAIQNALNSSLTLSGMGETFKVSALTTANFTVLKDINFIPATNNTTLLVAGDYCIFDKVNFIHSDYILHGVRLGHNCKYTNSILKGNFGHHIICANSNNIVTGNHFSGNAITPLVLQGSNHTATGNKFKDVGGFNIQTRFLDKAIISNNTFENTNYGYRITATSEQTVFTFTLDSTDVSRYVARLFTSAGVLDDASWNPTYSKVGNVITVTSNVGLTAGYIVELNAFVSLENININSESYDIIVDGNIIDGSGDSGIVLCADYHNGVLDPDNVDIGDYPKDITVTNNKVKNCLYAGIVQTHKTQNVTINGNSISECSLGAPYTNLYYSSGIATTGIIGISIFGNSIFNSSKKYMRNGIQYGGYPSLAISQDKQVKIVNNTFIGEFVRKVFIPNGEPTLRKHSIEVSGNRFEYPHQIDLDTTWTNAPANNPSISYSFVGGTGWTPETVIKSGGNYSAKTKAGYYVDISLLNKELLFGSATNIEISFMAKNESGESYIQFITTNAGNINKVSLPITDTNWKKYTMLITTDGLDKNGYCLLRIGASTGNAYFQHFRISGVTYE